MKAALTKLWHGLVLAVCVVGAAVAFRLGLATWRIAEATPDDRLLWWILTAGCAVLVLAFVREIWLRLSRLRARR